VFLVAQGRRVGKLRMLLLEPEARGLGLGRRLVDECIAFARAAGYRRVVLWTQSNLDAARHIYAAVGFRKIAEEPNDGFARDTMSETWELTLPRVAA
jgi:ribosomal protein S18 acetylase RimI-like enzyme